MKRIYVVTGANGHLASHIVRKLIERGETVRGLILPGDTSPALAGLPVDLVRGDVCNPSSIEALFKAEEPASFVVVHAAGIVQIDESNARKMYKVNVDGTSNIVAACWRPEVERLIYVSSVHAIPEERKGTVIRETNRFHPDNVVGTYAKTKAQATQIVMEAARAGMDAVVVHPSGIIGPGDYAISHTTQLLIDYFSGRLVAGVRGGYDFVDVRDVADGILSAAEVGVKSCCYILSNRFVTVKELFHMLYDIYPKHRVRLFLPLWFAQATAPFSELYYKVRSTKPLYTRYSLRTLQSNAIFSHEKADLVLGYRPRPMCETLRATVEWLERQGTIVLR